MLPDNRIKLEPGPISFDTVTGKKHDTFPEPGPARFDTMRSFLIGLLSNQSSFQEPVEFRAGTLFFDLNTNAYRFRTPDGTIINVEGDNWISLSNGIELEPGLTLADWFQQVRDLVVESDPSLSTTFSRLSTAIADEPISEGSFVCVVDNRRVANANSLVSGRDTAVGVATIAVGTYGTVTIKHIGLSKVRMNPGLTVSAGDTISLATYGRGTTVVDKLVGVVFDASVYDPSAEDPYVLALISTGSVGASSGSSSSSSGSLSLYGDGTDGNVTLGAGVTTLTREMYYNNLIIPDGATLNAGNRRVFVRGIATINGIMQNNGGTGANGSSGAGGVGGSVGTSGPIRQATAGGNGYSGSGVGSTAAGMTVALGGQGASGGSAGGNGGGSGGPQIIPTDDEGGPNPIKNLANALLMSAFSFGFLTEAPSPGSGGGGGAGNSATSGGGGGGGGGGPCVLVARTITGSGTMRALGGNGGNGFAGTAAGGGGGGGGGGIVLTISDNDSTIDTTITFSVAGGSPGAAAGGAGAAGTGAAGTVQHLVNR
jgi:hypothetical protein